MIEHFLHLNRLRIATKIPSDSDREAEHVLSVFFFFFLRIANNSRKKFFFFHFEWCDRARRHFVLVSNNNWICFFFFLNRSDQEKNSFLQTRAPESSDTTSVSSREFENKTFSEFIYFLVLCLCRVLLVFFFFYFESWFLIGCNQPGKYLTCPIVFTDFCRTANIISVFN